MTELLFFKKLATNAKHTQIETSLNHLTGRLVRLVGKKLAFTNMENKQKKANIKQILTKTNAEIITAYNAVLGQRIKRIEYAEKGANWMLGFLKGEGVKIPSEIETAASKLMSKEPSQAG